MTHYAVVAPTYPSHFAALQALAGELIERGHRVTFIHQAEAASWLRDPRIGFRAVGSQADGRGSLKQTLDLAANPGGPLGLRRLIGDLALNTQMLCQELPGAIQALQVDALICDQMEAAGGLIAEALEIPFVSIACALPVNREPGIPLPVMPMAYDPGESARRMYEGSTRVYDWMMGRHGRVLEAQALHFGLPVRSGLHEFLSPLAQISQTVAGFEFPRQALPAHFHHVGPLRPPLTGEADLTYDIDPERPMVFASLGTLQGHRFALFQRIAWACERLGAQLLVAHCGRLSDAQSVRLQEHGASWVTDFAPQRAALARANAVVTHAGLNTVMDALVARTPMLAIPIAFDQPGVASRVVHAGVGIKVSPRFTAALGIAERLEMLTTEPQFADNLDRLGSEVDAAGGIRLAAAIIEQAITTRQPVTEVRA
ncbi:glycosyltransferase, MGT family [Halopseudomonas xinjiangensis]|uniref:Glycosyltransferase, MGT family n=1 Tax=Halopseudomonas xinjiangensis TaxID=487184 RepID=A0A1H1Z0C9_9GAMM|nr:glycosyltransferase [Halopseudomonas xinjiangensis]SDT27073.1 glycosyltransferase, MGT family [Halopseudomonas xinjiangensis]